MVTKTVWLGLGLCAVLLAGCDTAVTRAAAPQTLSFAEQTARDTAIETKIAEVTAALLDLGPNVNAQEAARVAQIAVRAPLVWAQEWNVVDAPYLHNVKVVNGLREKGVCQDWADALDAALRRAGLQTLVLHRALGNVRTVSLEHATVILTARGQPMEQGLILDPWRIGQGQLWFARVAEDDRYDWESTASARAWRLANQKRAFDANG